MGEIYGSYLAIENLDLAHDLAKIFDPGSTIFFHHVARNSAAKGMKHDCNI